MFMVSDHMVIVWSVPYDEVEAYIINISGIS